MKGYMNCQIRPEQCNILRPVTLSKWKIPYCQKKSNELKVSWKKTCWKTTAERERHHHDGLLIATEHKQDGTGQQGTGITEGELQDVSKIPYNFWNFKTSVLTMCHFHTDHHHVQYIWSLVEMKHWTVQHQIVRVEMCITNRLSYSYRAWFPTAVAKSWHS